MLENLRKICFFGSYSNPNRHRLSKLSNFTKTMVFKKIDWSKFSQKINLPDPNDCTESRVDEYTRVIQQAARESIPIFSGFQTKNTVPWWNYEIKNAIKKKKYAFNTFKRHPSQENLITFKRLRAKARRSILDSKKKLGKHMSHPLIRTHPFLKYGEE